MIPAEAKLTLEFPEVFDEMTGTEVDNLFADRFKQRWGIWDRGGHMIMVLQWNETNSFLSKIYTEEKISRKDEKYIRKTLKDRSYNLHEFISGTVCGTEYKGFRYCYLVSDVYQEGKLLIFKKGNMIYTLYYYSRPDLDESNTARLEELMANFKSTIA